VSDPLDAAIAKIAARQHGNVTRRQLIALGLNDNAIAHRIKLGRLHRAHRGVYAVGRPATTALERAMASVLACGRGALLSHASAMTLYGFWTRWDSPFEVTVRTVHLRAGIRIHRSRTLTKRDIKTHLGIPVTSPARTIFDVAPRMTDKQLARAVNDGLLSEHLSRSHLAELLNRHPADRLTEFVTTRDGPTRSDWEREFPPFCKAHRLPDPVMSTIVAGHEVDAFWPDEKLIIELDSWLYHSSRASFESDRDKDADTLAAGYPTVRITWERMHDRPTREADRLHQIVAAQRRLLSRGSPPVRRSEHRS
jgi:putative AbiEi antitoxin of type IV toxin-antitoxin system